MEITDNKNWYPLGSGINGTVRSICKYRNELYVAGNFTAAGSVRVNGLAKWTGSQWVKIADVTGTIYSCVVFDDKLYIGGSFTKINNSSITNFSFYNGSNFGIIGVFDEIVKLKKIGQYVFALQKYNINENPINYVYVYDTAFPSSWQKYSEIINLPYEFLGNQLSESEINDIPIVNETINNKIHIKDIALLNSKFYFVQGNIYSAETFKDNIYLGGIFKDSIIQKFNGSTYSDVGGGIPLKTNTDKNTNIYSFFNDNDDYLYIGGYFDKINTKDNKSGISSASIAIWDDIQYYSIGNNISVNYIYSLYKNNDTLIDLHTGLYSGGIFNTINSIPAKNIAVFSEENVVQSLPPIQALAQQQQSCAPIIPCGFKIAEPTSSCGTTGTLIPGPPGPPGAPGKDGIDGENAEGGCGRVWFISMQKSSSHQYMWNNPIDNNMWTAIQEGNSNLPGANTPPSNDVPTQNQQIPNPGGFLHSNQDDFIEPFTNMNLDGEGNVDLSQFNTECDIAFDINHGTVFLPNPNWDGESTGPLTTDLSYYDQNGDPVSTAPIGGSQGPFLLPGYVVDLPNDGSGEVTCSDVIDCIVCIRASDPYPIILLGDNNQQREYTVSLTGIFRADDYIWSLPSGSECTITNIEIFISEGQDNWVTYQSTSQTSGILTIFPSSNTTAKFAKVQIEVTSTSPVSYTSYKWLHIISYGSEKAFARIEEINEPDITNYGHAKWKYRLKPITLGSDPAGFPTILEVFNQVDGFNLLEYNNNVNDVNNVVEGTVYGGIEVIQDTVTEKYTLKDFPGFSYEPVPVGSIVELTALRNSTISLLVFSAPNPIVGTCSSIINPLSEPLQNIDDETNTDGLILPPSSYDPIIIDNTDNVN